MSPDGPERKRQRTENGRGTEGPLVSGGASGGVAMADAAKAAAGDVLVDEDLHSRQIAVYGKESMARLATARVLVCGMRGLGAEIAKNVILAGVKEVAVQDAGTVCMADLGAHFYLGEEDVGKNRAEACAPRLQDLNRAVAVAGIASELSEGLIAGYNVVVMTDADAETAVRFNEACRAAGAAFVKADIRGVFGAVFCDFGDAFVVTDTDGEEPHTGIVAAISQANPALVNCVEDERLEFQDGDEISFAEVKGMTELNAAGPIKVKNVKAHSFEIECDTTAFGAYSTGGLVTQVKRPKTLAFKPLRAALPDPGEFLLTDFAKFDAPPLLHLAFQALGAFKAQHKRQPGVHCADDAAAVLALAKSINEAAPATVKVTLDEAAEKKIAALSHGASAELSPMAAMFGGIVGQEIIKAATGKFHPLHQFLYFDALESVPEGLTADDCRSGEGTRYQDQVAVFGSGMQDKLHKLNTFLVGAGALGCEFIKNFAMMGLACGSGSLTLTDDDTIEKSNLSRQFLFRDSNIGQPKSGCAAAAAKVMNTNLNVKAMQERVSPDTENVFNDQFWKTTDLVVNALDNVQARLYVDQRCVYFAKPLLESGTLGTKCNTQMVIPRLTENYGASRDPPEKTAPMCTLHSFPHNIHHCLTWARSEFEGAFEKTPSDVNAYLTRADYAKEVREAGDAQSREGLERAASCLLKDRCTTFDDCVRWARMNFEEYFHNKIAQLIYTFPEDAVTSTGTPFWSPPKRFPQVVAFSADDPACQMFALAFANLRAETFNIEKPAWASDAAAVARAVAGVVVPEFKPKSGVTIVTDPKATSASASEPIDDAAVIDKTLAEMEAVKAMLPAGYALVAAEFEKDDDTNFHMDAIASLANLRARNYHVEEVDKLKAKFIAGRIIPAIATTTAMATGLVCLELYKVLNEAPVEAYRNTFANLALPLFAMSEPMPPATLKYNGMEWSLWDRWVIDGDVTVQQLLDYFSEKKLSCYSVSCGQSLLYNSIFPKHRERMGKKVSELAFEIAKVEVPEGRDWVDVVVACEAEYGDEDEGKDLGVEDGEDVDIPVVSIVFKR